MIYKVNSLNIFSNSNYILQVFFLFFLGPRLQYTEVPRLGVEWELQLPAYARATATQDLSRVSNLHHSSRQHRIVNPQSKGRDRPSLFLVGFVNHCATTGTPVLLFLSHFHLYVTIRVNLLISVNKGSWNFDRDYTGLVDNLGKVAILKY